MLDIGLGLITPLCLFGSGSGSLSEFRYEFDLKTCDFKSSLFSLKGFGLVDSNFSNCCALYEEPRSIYRRIFILLILIILVSNLCLLTFLLSLSRQLFLVEIMMEQTAVQPNKRRRFESAPETVLSGVTDRNSQNDFLFNS